MSGVCSRRLSCQTLKGDLTMNELKIFESEQFGTMMKGG